MITILFLFISLFALSCGGDDDNAGQSAGEGVANNQGPLKACGVTAKHVETAGADDILFTDDNIEWLNVTTREIRFKNEPLSDLMHDKLERFSDISFHLGDMTLFDHIKLVTLADSRVYDDLVLCYGSLDDADKDGQPVWGYYLYDCYPLQYSSDKTVQANREKRAQHWELFTEYLKSKGKLKY